jgi:hypothetical protein
VIVDQIEANRQILELAARFPIGSEVTHAGQRWRVIGHREVGPFGPWLSTGAIPKLVLERDSSRVALAFDQVPGAVT